MIQIRTLRLTPSQQDGAVQVAASPDAAGFPHPRILTAGAFDGVHLAHQQLLKRVVDAAHPAGQTEEARRTPASGGSAIVLTFANHPLTVLAPPYVPKLLLGPERRAGLIDELGADVLIMPDFSPELAALEPERFVRDVLAGWLGVDRVIVGFDFRFGRGGRGDAALLSSLAPECGFEADVVSAVYHDEVQVSSTHIRELIELGEVREASEMLGRPHELEGKVERGDGRGTQIGYPTANLRFDAAYAIPPCGVYAVFADVAGRRYEGMMNIGTSPTFAGTEYRPEVHLLDFAGGTLYGESARVLFVERLREERKFESVQALQNRLHVDEQVTRALLESHPQRSGPAEA